MGKRLSLGKIETHKSDNHSPFQVTIQDNQCIKMSVTWFPDLSKMITAYKF